MYNSTYNNDSTSNSNMRGLMRDVDSYISELNQQEPGTPPTRAQSLHQPSRQSPHMASRSQTTYRPSYNNSREELQYMPSYYHPPPLPPRTSSVTPVKTSRPSLHASHSEQKMYRYPSDYVNTYLTHRHQADDFEPPSRPSSHRNSSATSSSSTASYIINTQLQPIEPSVSTVSSTSVSSTAGTPDYAYVSVLSRAFIRKVRGLEHVRELFCANEYPESFTGQEAIKMLVNLLDIPESCCISIANALMKSTPPLFDPIHYSQKSIIQGTVFNSADEYYTLQEDMTDTDVPTGILTSLLECYTYQCLPGQGECYAPRCPNKPDIFKVPEDVTVHSRPASDQLAAVTTHPQMAWAQRVSTETLKSLSKREIARQEAINEMIYSEEVYKNDLDTLCNVIVKPLSTKSAIIASTAKREQFVREVFGNYKAMSDVSTALFQDLLALQNQNECVYMIGDILIKHFAYFEDPFTQYCPRVSLAEYLVKEEQKANPDFERFIVQVEKSKYMRRLAFRHFLLNPVTRMQRYPLLLDAILKKTDADHPDFPYLTKCLDMVKNVAMHSDTLAEHFKRRVQILEINDAITFKQGEFQDLQLTDPHRRLYYHGEIKRGRSGITEVTEKSDLHLFVFDHLVLMTKPRSEEYYRVWKRPIPLSLMYVATSTSNVSVQPTSSSSRTLIHSSTTSTATVGLLLPIILTHLGQRGGVYTFLCTPDEKQKWITAIDEAKASMKKRLGEDVYDMMSLDDHNFRYFAAPNSSVKQGRVNCTVPFATMNNEEKIAVGTDNGVYFMGVDKKVLSCENVTQLAILENSHILVVLADKVLKAYPLDMLNSPPPNGKSIDRLGQELAQHVHFFQVGHCNNKHLLVYKKRKNTSSIFTCLEPMYDLRDPKNAKYITQKSGFMSSRSNHSWFKKYKELYIGTESTNIHFLKHKLLIVCDRGFEIIDPENLSVGGRDIPDKGDPQFNFVNRQADIKPLAMYRVYDKFLLCYSKLAFYVNNRNGSLVQRGPQKLPLLCEWEGNPENIVYQHPYIVAFSPQFIEVRHVNSGDLVQIIPGDQIRLTYFHTQNETTVIQGCMTHLQRHEVQHIFYLKLNPLRNNNARKYI